MTDGADDSGVDRDAQAEPSTVDVVDAGDEAVPEGLTVVLVAAVAANGVIGADGEMPWHLPADLEHFKRTTVGHPVVMGRRTFETIAARLGGPLPDRTNVVLSRSEPDLPPDVIHARSLPAALVAAAARDDVAYVVGGGTVYEQALPLADRLVLTELDAAHEGDTRFPDFDRAAWTVVSRDEREGFAFVTYERDPAADVAAHGDTDADG